MNSTKVSTCHITDISGQTQNGKSEVVVLDSSHRTMRALKKAGVFFGIAVVSVLVPMLHFVLVPGFLIVSGVVFAKTMSETKIATSIEAVCPNCKQTMGLHGIFKMSGTKETCPNCRQLLKVSFDEV
jgi:flagellar biosynthesis protein FlhB